MIARTLVVFVDVAPLSPNRTRRLHWGQRARLAHAARTEAVKAWLADYRPEATVPVDVRLIVRTSGRTMDQDNLIAACKPILDGLFNSAWTPNDSPEWVRLGEVTQEKCPKGDEAVVVTVTKRAKEVAE